VAGAAVGVWSCPGVLGHLALSDEHYCFRRVVAGESGRRHSRGAVLRQREHRASAGDLAGGIYGPAPALL
jgi:hypothetical protein